MSNEVIVIDPNEEHGPAFSALTEMQQKFVIASLMLGGSNDAEAARMAGYEVTTARQQGWIVSRKPNVIAAMREEAERRIQGGALLASSALVAIVHNAQHKDHFKACIELLNRSGLQFIQKSEVIHTDNRTAAELVNFIRVMAKKNGIDPATLLGNDEPPAIENLNVVEGEFKEVDQDLSAMLGEDDDDAE
jgi:phage terminase small subunit